MANTSLEGLHQPLLEEGWRTNSYSSSESLGGLSGFQKRKRSTKISNATIANTIGIVLLILMISLMIISVALNLYASSYEKIATTNATIATTTSTTPMSVVPLQPEEFIS